MISRKLVELAEARRRLREYIVAEQELTLIQQQALLGVIDVILGTLSAKAVTEFVQGLVHRSIGKQLNKVVANTEKFVRMGEAEVSHGQEAIFRRGRRQRRRSDRVVQGTSSEPQSPTRGV